MKPYLTTLPLITFLLIFGCKGVGSLPTSTETLPTGVDNDSHATYYITKNYTTDTILSGARSVLIANEYRILKESKTEKMVVGQKRWNGLLAVTAGIYVEEINDERKVTIHITTDEGPFTISKKNERRQNYSESILTNLKIWLKVNEEEN